VNGALVAMLVLANFAIASFHLAWPIPARHIVDLLANGEPVSWTIALGASPGFFNIFSGAILARSLSAARQKILWPMSAGVKFLRPLS